MDKEVKDGEMMAENETSAPEMNTSETEAAVNPNSEIIDFINRFAPGSDTSSPEAIITAATEVLKMLVPVHDKLYDLAVTSPENAAMLNDWMETGSLPKSIARNYDPEEITALIEEINDEEYETDRASYADKINQRNAREAELAANQTESQISAQEFIDKVQPTDDELEAFIAYHKSFLQDAVDNKMSFDHWMRAWKGFKYDGTVAELENKAVEAEEAGRIAGRNEQIGTEKLSRKDLADMMPEIAGSIDQPKKEDKPRPFAARFIDGVI